MTYGNRGIRNMAASGCYDAISSTFGQTSDSGLIWKILILEQCGHKRCISVWKDTMQRLTGASRGTSWRGGPELSPLLISTCSTIGLRRRQLVLWRGKSLYEPQQKPENYVYPMMPACLSGSRPRTCPGFQEEGSDADWDTTVAWFWVS